jgi:hypothetical protein
MKIKTEDFMETKTKNTSFRCAFDQVPHGKIREVKDRLKRAIGIKSDSGLMFKVNGVNQVKLLEAMEIEAVFREYGITVEWGCKKEEGK